MDLYHVLNRGVERKTIFLDSGDHARFVHDLYEFNDTRPANNTNRQEGSERSRNLLVDIHGWCLMKNHYHLLLSERPEGDLPLFVRKLNVGYGRYFNEKYERSGYVFQGRTKKILIRRNAHFLHILHYIHLNPLDMIRETSIWREGRLRDAKAALEHLRSYRWSSYNDYCGRNNFPSVLTTNLFSSVFGNYEKTVAAYIHDMDLELNLDSELTLE